MVGNYLIHKGKGILVKGLATVFMLGVASGVSLAGNTQGTKKEPKMLKEVVVSASRVKETKREVTSNVTVITSKEIALSPAVTVGDLLAEKGIGHIQKYPGGLTSIGIRGFRTEAHGNDLMGHVLILVDGRRAGTGNVAKILTKNVERIEIIRGPASVQYGSAAIGGVVNIITKRGKGKPHVFVEGTYGSYDYAEGTFGGYGKVKGLDFSGTVSRSTLNDDYKTGSGHKFYNTGYDSIDDVSLNLGATIYPGHRIGMIYHYYGANKLGNPGYLSQNDKDDYKDSYNKSIDLMYQGRSCQGMFSWMGRYFNGVDEDRWVNPTASNPTGWDTGQASKRKTDQQGAQGQLSLNLKKLTATAGFDWVDYDIKASWTPQKTEYKNPAGFFLAKGRLFNDRLILTGGLRYDHYEVKVIRPTGRSEDDNHTCFRAGAAYLLGNYLKLRANFGEGFVMPAADQLAADYEIWGTHYVGNPDLNPEKSKTYEGGVDFFYHALNASATYFYTDFDDKIVVSSGPGGIRTWENHGSANIKGLEGSLSYDVGALFGWDFELKPYANFVYLFTYEDGETHRDLKYVSDWNASYGITLSGLKEFSGNLNFSYVGKQKVDDWESGLYPVPVVTKGGFTVADLTLSYKIYESKKYGSLLIKGDVRNLFDKDYAYVKGYPMPGRTFYGSLTYTF